MKVREQVSSDPEERRFIKIADAASWQCMAPALTSLCGVTYEFIYKHSVEGERQAGIMWQEMREE